RSTTVPPAASSSPGSGSLADSPETQLWNLVGLPRTMLDETHASARPMRVFFCVCRRRYETRNQPWPTPPASADAPRRRGRRKPVLRRWQRRLRASMLAASATGFDAGSVGYGLRRWQRRLRALTLAASATRPCLSGTAPRTAPLARNRHSVDKVYRLGEV